MSINFKSFNLRIVVIAHRFQMKSGFNISLFWKSTTLVICQYKDGNHTSVKSDMLDKVHVSFYTEHKDNSNYVRKLVICSTTHHLDLFNTFSVSNYNIKISWRTFYSDVKLRKRKTTCNQLIR